MNKEAAQRHEEERKKKVMDKMSKNQQQQDYIATVRERERQLHQKEKEVMTRKREYQAQLAKEREMCIKESLLQKFREDEEKVKATQSMKEKEMELIKEERDLYLQMKRENVERIKRMQEYKRQETMKKISENSARTEDMLMKKQELAKCRQKNAIEAKIRRDKLMQILEKSKTSGGKAIKKILSDLENNEGSIKAPKKKNVQIFDSTISKSPKKASTTKPPSIIEIGPPSEAPSLVNRIPKSHSKSNYISPYAATRIK